MGECKVGCAGCPGGDAFATAPSGRDGDFDDVPLTLLVAAE